MRKALLATFNLILFTLGLLVIIYFWWTLLAKNYIGGESHGGDYFNALTYANFIYKYHPFPPQGWLPFWNEGWLLGGYPWLFFYLIIPLVKFWALPNAMEALATFLILLYFISSFVLFWKISKNILVGFALTLITIYTRASYYQLTTVGSIVSAGGQFFLPIMLLLIYLYEETRKTKLLVISGLLGGLAFLYHSPLALLTTMIPSVVILLSYDSKPAGRKILIKLRDVVVFLTISIATGSLGVYTLIIQTFEGSGVDKCTSPECWGVYPRHLQTWLNLLAPGVFIGFLLVLLVIFIIKRRFSLKFLTPSVFSLLTLIAYAVLARLKLIDGITNSFFPTRTFWAINAK
ncbi:hypothetical protein HY045_00295 [Candidatus Woesebacteria bacterium]|nr:hypothetical protein [Candidatus Woesebacteria bacterium]